MAKGNILDLFDKEETRIYENGVSNCAIFLYDAASGDYGKTNKNGGVCWNGITSIHEHPSGAEPHPIYMDGVKCLNLFTTEEFCATIDAYTYPEEFALCDGSSEIISGCYFGEQPRKKFGLAYTTKVCNAVNGDDYSEQLHIVYGAKASPSEKQYQAINSDPDIVCFSWELTTMPVSFYLDNREYNTSTVVVDRKKVGSKKYKKLLDVIYGTSGYLPEPSEVKYILASVSESPYVYETTLIYPDSLPAFVADGSLHDNTGSVVSGEELLIN